MAFVSFVSLVFVSLFLFLNTKLNISFLPFFPWLNKDEHEINEINEFIVSLASALRNSYETGCLTHQKSLYVSCSFVSRQGTFVSPSARLSSFVVNSTRMVFVSLVFFVFVFIFYGH